MEKCIRNVYKVLVSNKNMVLPPSTFGNMKQNNVKVYWSLYENIN